MATVNNNNNTSGFKFIFRALKHRNYRLFFTGQCLSLIGTWMTQIATSWLVYRLTGNVFWLGIIGFMGQIPILILGPFAGVLADRYSRHRLITIAQVIAMVQSFILAILTLSHLITIWQLIILSLFQGLINAVDMPARQAFLVEMIEDREDLGNAIALNSSIVNVARLLGPAIAGILIAAVGEGWCFLTDGFSYLAVIAALLAMRIAPYEKKPAQDMRQQLKEGFAYTFGFAPVRAIILLMALFGLVGMPYAVVMPVFAKEILRGDAHTFSFLMSASGLGALTGAIYLASRKSVLGLGKNIALAAIGFGFGLIILAFTTSFWLALLLMVLIGFGIMVQMASSNTVLQTLVDDKMRGRVMSFFTIAFLGMIPFGSLLTGTLASKIGVSYTLTFNGICALLGSLWFAIKLPALTKMMQPVYMKKGIISEIAQGIQTATALTTPPED